jgi:hypothetical protein
MNDALPLFDSTPARSFREKVVRLEDALKHSIQTGELQALPEQVTHHFAPGIYMRELFIPKGAVLTGKIHRHAHQNVLLEGDISVMTEHGVKRLKAPCIIYSSAGIKRAGFAHENTRWLTVHATNETDLEKLETELIAPDFEALGEIDVKPDQILEVLP